MVARVLRAIAHKWLALPILSKLERNAYGGDTIRSIVCMVAWYASNGFFRKLRSMIIPFLSWIFPDKTAVQSKRTFLYQEFNFKIEIERLTNDDAIRYVLRFHGGCSAKHKLSEESFVQARARAEELVAFIESASYISVAGRSLRIIDIPYEGSIADILGLTALTVPFENVKYRRTIFSTAKNHSLIDLYICERGGSYYCLLSGNISTEGKNIYEVSLDDAYYFANQIVQF